MLRIGLVGYGRIGRALVALLQQYPKRFQINWISDPAYFKDDAELIKRPWYDVIVNAGPYDELSTVYHAAVFHGRSYIDFTEGNTRDTLLQNPQILAVPHCGLAPGAISIIGRHAWEQDRTDAGTLFLSVGALPLHKPKTWWDHGITWSPEGLVHEHFAPCDVINSGQHEQTAPLTYYRWIDRIDGNDDYESYTTSGGLGTLCHTLSENSLGPMNLVYRSIRYRGHHEKMHGLIHGVGMVEEELLSFVKRSMPVVVEDKVIMMIETPKRTRRAVIHGTEINGQKLSAIAYATASGAAVVLDLMEAGKLLRTEGIILQEEITGSQFLHSVFSEPYWPLFY